MMKPASTKPTKWDSSLFLKKIYVQSNDASRSVFQNIPIQTERRSLEPQTRVYKKCELPKSSSQLLTAREIQKKEKLTVKFNPIAECNKIDIGQGLDCLPSILIEPGIPEHLALKRLSKFEEFKAQFDLDLQSFQKQICRDNKSKQNVVQIQQDKKSKIKIKNVMYSLEDFDIKKLNVQILTKDYLEASTNYLNGTKIKEKNLLRIVEISKTYILKQILQILFWLYITNLQELRNIENDQKLIDQFEDLLHDKYYILLSNLHQPKDIILEFLPILISKAITLILIDNLYQPLDEIYGIYGFKKECQLFIYQFVIQKINGPTFSLSTVDKIQERILCSKKQSDWQMILYQAHKFKYSKMVQKLEKPKYENLKKVKFIKVEELHDSSMVFSRGSTKVVRNKESLDNSRTSKQRSQSIDKTNFLRNSFAKNKNQSNSSYNKFKTSLKQKFGFINFEELEVDDLGGKRPRGSSHGSDEVFLSTIKSTKSNNKVLSARSLSDESGSKAQQLNADQELRKKNFFIRAQQCNLDLKNQKPNKNQKVAFDKYGISNQLKNVYKSKKFTTPMMTLGLGHDSRRNPPLRLSCQTRVAESQSDQVMNKFAAKFNLNHQKEELDKPKFMKTLEQTLPLLTDHTRSMIQKTHSQLKNLKLERSKSQVSAGGKKYNLNQFKELNEQIQRQKSTKVFKIEENSYILNNVQITGNLTDRIQTKQLIPEQIPKSRQKVTEQKPQKRIIQDEIDSILSNHKIPLYQSTNKGVEKQSFEQKVKNVNYFRHVLESETTQETETSKILTTLNKNEDQFETKVLKIPNLNFNSKIKTSKFLAKQKKQFID